MKRWETKKIKIGNIYIGGTNKVAIQSMSTFLPSDFTNCLNQIKKLEEAGCEIVRVAIKSKEDAERIKDLKEKINIPIVADIHFDYNLGIEAILNGADKIRFNPGNIGEDENLEKLIALCIDKDIPVRIGVNAGSLERKYINEDMPLVEKALKSLSHYVSLCESYGLKNMVLSIKMSNVLDTVEAYKKASEMFDYPLHIGLTEAGIGESAIIKSSIAIGSLLLLGIGDTIRVSLTGDPVKEVYVAKDILKSVGLYSAPDLISCPTCGRCEVNLEKYAKEIDDFLKTIKKPVKVAVMGCIVNGPGEAREADMGVAFMKDKGVLFVKGKTILTSTPDDVIEKLKEEILKF